MVLATKKNCQRVLAAGLRVVSAMTGNPPQQKILNQAASTRCSGDNKEKLSTNIRSEYASDFCHDRKFAFKDLLKRNICLIFSYKLFSWLFIAQGNERVNIVNIHLI